MTAPLPFAAALARDPSWLPFQFDPATDRVLLIRKSEDDYRAAAFLDQRSLGAAAERRLAEWAEVAGAFDPTARRDAQYIFHIGHVGSTLLSRLLGELDGVLALREPLLLRTFAELLGNGRLWTDAEAAARLDTATALLSRTFRPGQRALIKATSFVSEIADRLVPPRARALFVSVRPRVYIETILGGDASRQELAMLTAARAVRLAARCPGLTLGPVRMTEAHQAALAWATEATSLERSAAALGAERVGWIDFDAFLDRPAHLLSAAAAFLGHPVHPAAIEAICAGPLMRRYSKSLEYDYSPELRRDVLADARRRFGSDIDAALAWLNEAGRRWPAIAAALNRG